MERKYKKGRRKKIRRGERMHKRKAWTLTIMVNNTSSEEERKKPHMIYVALVVTV